MCHKHFTVKELQHCLWGAGGGGGDLSKVISMSINMLAFRTFGVKMPAERHVS